MARRMAASLTLTLMGTALAALALAPAQAQDVDGASYDPPYLWVGAVKLVDYSSGCEGADFLDNFPGTASYRPKLQSGEGNSGLSLVFNRSATIVISTSSTSQLHGSGKYKGTTIAGKVFYRGTAGPYDFDITPSAITTSTGRVTLRGTIGNYWGRRGCTVTISATLGPKR